MNYGPMLHCSKQDGAWLVQSYVIHVSSPYQVHGVACIVPSPLPMCCVPPLHVQGYVNSGALPYWVIRWVRVYTQETATMAFVHQYNQN